MSTAFITGAASGLGSAIARRLADDGCAIVAADRDRAALDRVVADLAATGARVTALQVDVTDFDAMQRAGEQAEAFGAIDPDETRWLTGRVPGRRGRRHHLFR